MIDSTRHYTSCHMVAAALLVLVAFTQVVTSQCTTINNTAQQWPRGSTVYYNFGNITDPAQIHQIQMRLTTDAATAAIIPEFNSARRSLPNMLRLLQLQSIYRLASFLQRP